MRGVTGGVTPQAEWGGFQLTRLMRGVTQDFYVKSCIHRISTHTPHARRDFNIAYNFSKLSTFQLTRLMRGVTASPWLRKQTSPISTHTPHARRDDDINELKAIFNNDFNSHASCEA